MCPEGQNALTKGLEDAQKSELLSKTPDNDYMTMCMWQQQYLTAVVLLQTVLTQTQKSSQM